MKERKGGAFGLFLLRLKQKSFHGPYTYICFFILIPKQRKCQKDSSSVILFSSSKIHPSKICFFFFYNNSDYIYGFNWWLLFFLLKYAMKLKKYKILFESYKMYSNNTYQIRLGMFLFYYTNIVISMRYGIIINQYYIVQISHK